MFQLENVKYSNRNFRLKMGKWPVTYLSITLVVSTYQNLIMHYFKKILIP